MPTTRRMGISERKEKAFDLFGRQWKNADVAREVGVHPDTVTRYRREYEERLVQQSASSPDLLRNVVGNTVRALDELSNTIREAWRQYESCDSKQVKATYLGLALKAQSERAKLFGLMGVKPDTAALFEKIKRQHDQLIAFMRENLCDDDRERLINFVVDNFHDELESLPTA